MIAVGIDHSIVTDPDDLCKVLPWDNIRDHNDIIKAAPGYIAVFNPAANVQVDNNV